MLGGEGSGAAIGVRCRLPARGEGEINSIPPAFPTKSHTPPPYCLEGAKRQSRDIYFLRLFKARRDFCYPSPTIISRCKSCAGLRLFSLLNWSEQRIFGDDLLEAHTGRDRAGYCCLPAQGRRAEVLLWDDEQRPSLQNFSLQSGIQLLLQTTCYSHTAAIIPRWPYWIYITIKNSLLATKTSRFPWSHSKQWVLPYPKMAIL